MAPQTGWEWAALWLALCLSLFSIGWFGHQLAAAHRARKHAQYLMRTRVDNHGKRISELEARRLPPPPRR